MRWFKDELNNARLVDGRYDVLIIVGEPTVQWDWRKRVMGPLTSDESETLAYALGLEGDDQWLKLDARQWILEARVGDACPDCAYKPIECAACRSRADLDEFNRDVAADLMDEFGICAVPAEYR